ncbi:MULTISPECIES: dTMP kinase [unclassified Lentilitoribacter]|uniref:dTMP kinase n=1 Tax=unclassified Lentilitoribacter TaxID=2647570 RepID=UPI0013A690F8|nr:dTMP kinase [Lentilitoribacter sp. Alg239-R112]
MNLKRGRFITFEGGEGAGKSTQIKLLAEKLKKIGHDVVVTREPGGSVGAEAARHVLLSGAAEEFGVRMEAFLFAAARSDHVEEVIRPAVKAGRVVLCDRFADSTRIYQGVTGNIEANLLESLERVAVNNMYPDMTLIIDVPAEVGMRRAKERSGTGGTLDRFEREEMATHEMRREGFLDLAKEDPVRCRIIDGDRDVNAIFQDVFETVELALPAILPKKARGKRFSKNKVS